VTNVTRDQLSVTEAMELVRLRWQIELIFKLWKSHGGIDEWSTTRSLKVLCGVYARLLAMIVQHWVIVVGCWRHADRSPTKAARVVQVLSLRDCSKRLKQPLWAAACSGTSSASAAAVRGGPSDGSSST
jgi:IS4 transposase